LLISERLNTVANMHKYQDETMSSRDPKVKEKEFDTENLVLLRRPCTKSSDKLKQKWEGPNVAIGKTRPRAYRFVDPQGLKLEH
jgi:hypothetical protein